MKGPVEPVHRSVPETIQEVIELTGFLCYLFRSTPIFSSLLDCLYSMIEFTVTLNHQSSHPPVHRITRRKSSAAHPSSFQRHSPSWAPKLLNRQNLSHTSAPQPSPKSSPAAQQFLILWTESSKPTQCIRILDHNSTCLQKLSNFRWALYCSPALAQHRTCSTKNTQQKKQDSQKNVAHYFQYQIPN